MSSFHSPIDLAAYLFTRLQQMGVRSVHGVPGDYNLTALDILHDSGLHWVGNCNELNGGYAADGYARVKGIGAMVTTFGVGELSAMNAHAGAFAEHVPLVHVVGSPGLAARASQSMILHHTIGNHEYDTFSKLFDSISVGRVRLDRSADAPREIDTVLQRCWELSRPVYIELPMDMVKQQVEGLGLKRPLHLGYNASNPLYDQKVADDILNLLYLAKRPCILLDILATRSRLGNDLEQLAVSSQLPMFLTPLTRGSVNETSPSYGGMYAGAGSDPGVQSFVEGSDLVLLFGPLDTDVNKFWHSAHLPKSSTVRINPGSVELCGQFYTGLHLRGITRAIIDRIDLARVTLLEWVRPMGDALLAVPDECIITHKRLWPLLNRFFKSGDVILADTGTASFGLLQARFPANVTIINPSLWAAIGYALPAGQGAALAARDNGRCGRTIILQGDGSFQLTCQEISTMIRENLSVILFILSNDGYTIEREVHPTHALYNDISRWNYRKILDVFEGHQERSKSYLVKTSNELQTLLENEEFDTFKGVQLVEVELPRDDVPILLDQLAGLIRGD